MAKQSTVFVLGAGAGEDIGMPLGWQLAGDIRARTHVSFHEGRARITDEVLCLAFQRPIGDGRERIFFPRASQIQRGLVLAPSIDEYLFAHRADPDLQLLGKLAIARSILEFEGRSNLYMEGSPARPDLAKVADSWLVPLFRFLNLRVEASNAANVFDDLFIINFNYDRCIEHFLYYAVIDYFGLKPPQAAAAVNRLQIIHPYGTIGALPWQERKPNTEAFEFGVDVNELELQRAARNLRTFNEETPTDQANAIRELVVRAGRIVFLGFHFHPQNIDLLLHQKPAAQFVYATTFQRSEDDKRILEVSLQRFLAKGVLPSAQPRVRFVNGKCTDAFREHGLLWSSTTVDG
jgi:hypothetical protein